MSTSEINQPKDFTVSIPAAIVGLSNLNLLEKAVLGHVSRFPACSNTELAELTGLSVRGVEAMLARLRERGLIKRLGEGRARRHQLTVVPEPRGNCGKSEVEQSHVKCGNDGPSKSHRNCGRSVPAESHKSCAIGATAPPVSNHEEKLADFADRHLTLFENCFTKGVFAKARKHIEQILGRIEWDTETPSAQQVEWHRNLVKAENCCLVLETMESIAPNKRFSRNQFKEAVARLGKVDLAKLALFREKVEAGESAASAISVLGLMDG